ncbi:hypothetical protein ACVW0Q_002203 [Thermostichus sp. MS-CIW-21]|jgi:hypothetical protein|uniref:hypothetical protein n=1 Tax=unclassified Synechococcus TaxID=2626047 RepID=UPI0000694612|nr:MULTISPECIES: hypothetical protein [unclassified Synechococcus]ABD00140.1 conserved hypothetical protein [Synechococcus sp. JA-3-3Ab]PIK86962.1 hypothetical protein SYN63AY4M2_11385 [Synechococcus sp. 63AY4M2]PIK87880.1 hypothetical protein SYN65AY6A5_01650 [Synechococcus sp. 65AY6A5]PIK92319.1 hypothetical protein SYN65AY6LI_08865 [Synechococcus sp. 65AY6Li]PIK96033.1 hypothetical protein SYN60AY4M2_12000 [Synechococcus sp. 60AY4M2]
MWPFLLLAIYAGGVWYSARKADRIYSGSGKWAVSALWPLLLLTNRQFRQNWRRPLNK